MALSKPIEIGAFIDDSRVSALQYITVGLCALVAVLDGIDTLSIGIAAKAMTQAYHVKPADFGPVFGAALLGALVGSLTFGALGDRFGRKKMLIASTLSFAVFTAITPWAPSLHSLQVVRFLAGLGLGGAPPCFVALTAEYAPKRLRSIFVTVQYAAFPLGGMIGGFLSSFLLIHYGWQSVFYVGSILPILVALILTAIMPESLRFLVSKTPDSPAIEKIARRIDPRLPQDVRFFSQEQKLAGLPTKYLFTNGRAANTMLVWVAFFTSFAVLIFIPLWSPLILGRVGVSIQAASFILSLNTFGAVLGMSSSGFLVGRLGAYRVMVLTFAGGAVTTAMIGAFAETYPLLVFSAVAGGAFIAAGASSAIVLASEMYPTTIRSTGLGWAFGMAKLGQVVVPLSGGIMMAREWSVLEIYGALGGVASIGLVAVILIRTPKEARASTNAKSAPTETASSRLLT